MIEKSKIINVLNYNENPVCIKTHLKEYLCPKMEDGNPSVTPLEFSEVEFLNSNSPVFRTGTLFFEDDVQEEIYEALRITNWKDILRNKDVEDILLHPTLDGLTKIININSVMLFERVRGIFHTLKNSNQYDISTRVEKIVNTRYKELCNKKLKTEIILTAKDTVSSVQSEDVNDLKKQNELLQEQMANMQKMLEKMMLSSSTATKKNETQAVVESDTNEESATVEPTKKRGRPSAKK